MTAVLVPDVQARAPLAALRSLGRAGYETHAVSHVADAIGLKSALARHSAVHPPYADAAFLPWLRAYVARHAIRMIVPTSGLLHAVQSAFDEFKPLLPVAGDPDLIFPRFSKCAVYEAYAAADPALGLLDNHPRSWVVDLTRTTEPDLPDLPGGYYVKAEHALGAGGNLEDSGFAYVPSRDKVPETLAAFARTWPKALVQEGCPGRQIGVSALMHQGKALAVTCSRDLHALPHSKGTMSLRESCWIPQVAEDAVRRLAHLGWQGCAMVEYRLDEATGAFYLIEINFRYWQALHLDIHAGVDFPRLQAEWFLDGRTDFGDVKMRPGVVLRDPWPGEVAHLVNVLRRRDVGAGAKLGTLALFLGRFLDPRIHTDFSFPGDRRLAWYNFRDFVAAELRGIFGQGS